MRALVADDEPLICELLRRFLSRRGYAVVTVGDGEGALEDLRQHRPDLFLLDIALPKMDGLSVLQCIRDESLDVGTIWTMTGKADDDAVKRSLDLGAADVFTKPLNLPHLDWLLQLEQGRVAADDDA
jgi:DNA-binding response OmpR family regulator